MTLLLTTALSGNISKLLTSLGPIVGYCCHAWPQLKKPVTHTTLKEFKEHFATSENKIIYAEIFAVGYRF